MRYLLIFVTTAISFHAHAIQAKFDLQQFYAPSVGSYVEIQIRVLANSVAFTKIENNKVQAGVEISLQIKKDTTTVKYDKFRLKSPICDSTNLVSFQDLQRYALDTGSYTLFLFLKDVNDRKNTLKFEYKFKVRQNQKTYISDVTLCGSPLFSQKATTYTKHNLEIYPRLGTLYQNKIDSLHFYTEIYNLNAATISFYLFDIDNNKKIPSSEINVKTQQFLGIKPIHYSYDLSQIATGNYALALDIKSDSGLIAQKTVDFQRINAAIVQNQDYLDSDFKVGFAANYALPDLKNHLKSLYPITKEREQLYIDNLLRPKTPDLVDMQKFFLWFWQQRNALQPAQAWAEYQVALQKVQNSFGNKFTKGYQTERGRIYLKYGEPNGRNSVENDPQAYPYEIWQYNRLGTQSQVRFVFYNPSLTATDYVLLHSDARNEPKMDNWRNEIYSRNGTGQRNINKENGSRDLKNGRLEDMYRNQ